MPDTFKGLNKEHAWTRSFLRSHIWPECAFHWMFICGEENVNSFLSKNSKVFQVYFAHPFEFTRIQTIKHLYRFFVSVVFFLHLYLQSSIDWNKRVKITLDFDVLFCVSSHNYTFLFLFVGPLLCYFKRVRSAKNKWLNCWHSSWVPI